MPHKLLSLFLLSLLVITPFLSLFSPVVKASSSSESFNSSFESSLTLPIVPSDDPAYGLMVQGNYSAYFKNNSLTKNAVMIRVGSYNFTQDISTSQLHWYNSTYNAIIGMVNEMNPQNTIIAGLGESSILYENAWVNTNLQYQPSIHSLKETLIINNVSSPSSSIKPDYLQYVSNIYYSSNLTIYANGIGYLHPTNQIFQTNGKINFNNELNQTIATLPVPVISDNAGNVTLGFYAVTANNGVLIVNIRIPTSFVNSASYPIYFDPTFSDGFESGDLTGWTTSSASSPDTIGVSSALSAHHGQYFGTASLAGDGSESAYVAKTVNSVEYWAGVYYRFRTAQPAASKYFILTQLLSTSQVAYVTYEANAGGAHAIQLKSASGASYDYTPVAIELNLDQWYFFEIHALIDGAAGVFDVWLNGTNIIHLTGKDSNNYGTNITSIRVGCVGNGATAHNVDFDCAYFNSSGYVNPETTTNYYPYIQDSSNVDNTPDIGTHNNFTALQSAPDLINDTLTEADNDAGTSKCGVDTVTGSSSTVVAANQFFGGSYTASSTGEVSSVSFWARGTSGTVNCKAVITGSSGNILTNGVGGSVACTITAGTKTSNYASGSRPILVSGTTYWVGVIPDGNLNLLYQSTSGGVSKNDTTNSYASPTNPSDASEGTVLQRQLYATILNINYVLSSEDRFTEIPTGYTNRELCIFTGPYSTAEGITVQGWNPGNSTWTSIASLTANQWNNVSIASWIDSANTTFYVRFISASDTGDTVQSNWQIDALLLHFYNATGGSIAVYGLTLILISNSKVGSTSSFSKGGASIFALSKNGLKSSALSKQGYGVIGLIQAATRTLSFQKIGASLLSFIENGLKTATFSKGGTSTLSFSISSLNSVDRILQFIGSSAITYLMSLTKTVGWQPKGTSALNVASDGFFSFTQIILQYLNIFASSTLDLLSGVTHSTSWQTNLASPINYLSTMAKTFGWQIQSATTIELLSDGFFSFTQIILQYLNIFASSTIDLASNVTHIGNWQLFGSSLIEYLTLGGKVSNWKIQTSTIYSIISGAFISNMLHALTIYISSIIGIAQETAKSFAFQLGSSSQLSLLTGNLNGLSRLLSLVGSSVVDLASLAFGDFFNGFHLFISGSSVIEWFTNWLGSQPFPGGIGGLAGIDNFGLFLAIGLIAVVAACSVTWLFVSRRRIDDDD
jgi:hypothetical protein